MWIWWKCRNFVRLSRTIDRHNKCAAADPPLISSQEVSRSSEIGERASARSCVHASPCVVLRPFSSLLLVRSAGAQSVAAVWREFLEWNCEDCCYSGGTELGQFGKGKKCSGCVSVGWGNRGPGRAGLDLFWCCSVLFNVLVFSLYRRHKKKRAEDCCSFDWPWDLQRDSKGVGKRAEKTRTRQEISLVATRNERWEEASWAGAAGKQAFKELVCVSLCVCVCYVPCVVKEEGKKGKDRTWVEETDRSPEPREKETQRKQRSKLLKAASLTPTRRPWPYNARRACRPSCAPLVRSSAKNTLKLSIPRSTLEFASLICSRSRHIYNLKNSFPMDTSNTTPPLSLPLGESWACKNDCCSNGSVVVVVVYVCISCGPSLLLLHGVQDSTLQKTANLCVQYPVNSFLQVLWTLCVLTRTSTVCHFCLGRSMLWVLEKEGGCCCWQWLWLW